MAVYTSIDDPTLHFRVKVYSGSGSSGDGSTDNIVYDETDTSMKPTMVWIKNRTTTHSGTTYFDIGSDTLRYFSPGEGNDAEVTPDGNVLSSFNSNGFTVGPHATTSGSGNSLVSFSWKESVASGFDLVTYSGTSSNLDVSHNLSAVPHFIMIKQRSDNQAWRIYHKDMTIADPYSNRLVLSEDGAQTTSALGLDADPTSSVINIGTDTGCTNGSGETYVAFCFTEKQGYSKFGNYKGNGNADGPFAYTGFRPAFIMIKNATASGNWEMFDAKRSTFNLMHATVYADVAGSEYTGTGNQIDVLSNGFKCRANDTNTNDSGETHLFIAFAEAPFVNSNGVPCNAR